MPLKVLPSTPTIAPSKTSKWRAATLVAIHLLIAAHITHWLVTGNSVTPVEPSEAIAFSRGGIVNAGLIFFAATILLTLIFGRFFCGWACHLVALQDLCRSLLLRIGIRPRPLRSRLLRWVPTFAFAYMFLWPIAYRVWIGDDLSRGGTEFTTEHFWSTFPGWFVGLLTFAVCGFVVVYFLGAKGFCSYACPYGAAFAGADRLSPLRIRVTDACAGCGHCTAVCSSNVRVHEEVRAFGMVVDSGCMKCLDCVSVCPNDALYYGFGAIPWFTKARAEPRRRQPRFSWSEEVVLAAAFVLTFFSVRGLYGTFPFLLSLGIAGILAYFSVTAWQLVVRDHVSLRGRRLKRAGSLERTGLLFGFFFGAVCLLVLHSGAVQTSRALGDHAYRSLGRARAESRSVIETPPSLSTEERAAAARARGHFQRTARWGLLPTPGLARKTAWTAFLAGPLEVLEQSAETALTRGEAPEEMHELLAHDAWTRGLPEVALEHYTEAAAAAPHRADLALHLGMVAAQASQLDRAAEILAAAAVRFPKSIDIAYNAGVIEAMRGSPVSAVDHFERVLSLDDQRRDARENLAGMLAATGRFEASIGHYRRALADAPGDLETRVLLVRVLSAAGLRAEAEAEIEELQLRAPGHPSLPSLNSAIQPSGASPLPDR